jgi:hypothetical protein
VSAPRRKKALGEKSVTASDIEEAAPFPHDFGAEKAAIERVRPGAGVAVAEFEKIDPLVREMRRVVGMYPQAPELAQIVPPEEPDEYRFAYRRSSDNRFPQA